MVPKISSYQFNQQQKTIVTKDNFHGLMNLAISVPTKSLKTEQMYRKIRNSKEAFMHSAAAYCLINF